MKPNLPVALLSDEMKDIELRARQMRAQAVAALFSGVGSTLLRMAKRSALLITRPRVA